MSAADRISLRGVEVHNLQAIDLDLPHRELIVFCGVSGSGKTSLALDTLYAEGQRRYIESFSAYTRQFLERLERPEAERIDGIPPAIAVSSGNTSRSSRSTVGTATETADYLRLLFAKIGRVVCRGCGQEVRRDSPQSAAEVLGELPDRTRYMLAFRTDVSAEDDCGQLAAELREDGFLRVIAGGRTINLDEAVLHGDGADASLDDASEDDSANGGWYVIVDRLATGKTSEDRLRDSLETAFGKGRGRCFAFVEAGEVGQSIGVDSDAPSPQPSPGGRGSHDDSPSPRPSPSGRGPGRGWESTPQNTSHT